MLSAEQKIKLEDLEYQEYLAKEGIINSDFEGKIAVYAIFDQDKNIQYIGYTRNLFKSLQQHLIRKIDQCYWLKAYIIERPSRSILEGISHDWKQTNENLLPSEQEQKQWTQPINTRQEMTATEKQEYEQEGELQQIKILKKVARRVEGKIKEKLDNRGITMNLRFNPKLKEEGLLDLK